jgi:hypothetical protein
MFESLDFIYVPTGDVDGAAAHHQRVLGAQLLWKVRAMDTTVAALRLSSAGPQILLSGHLTGERPILVYRVADYASAVAALRAGGLTEVEELEIPHGPCAAFRIEGGQRYAIYQLTRPHAEEHFADRIDE